MLLVVEAASAALVGVVVGRWTRALLIFTALYVLHRRSRCTGLVRRTVGVG